MKNSVRINMLFIMILTIFTKLLGLFREMVFSYYYGVSNIADAFNISLTIPVVIFALVGTGISTGFIPAYSNIISTRGKEKANDFANNLINAVWIVLSILVIIVFLFTESIIKLFASGFTGETLSIAIYFTKISIFGVYFSVLTYLYSSLLRVEKLYYIPTLIIIPYSVVEVISIILSKYYGIIILPIGSVFAIIAQILLIEPFLKKVNYRYKSVINFKDKDLKNFFYLIIPIILGVSVNEINVLVDKTLASRLAIGGISALNYSSRVVGIIQAIFVLSITSIIYPVISKMAAEGNLKGLKTTIIKSIKTIIIFIIPITIGAFIFSEQIIELIFGRGEFDSNAINMTKYTLSFFSIGMIGYGLREILSNAFYSLQDTKAPVINSSIGVLLNIVLSIVLSKSLGIGGLALATSISAIITSILLYKKLKVKIGDLEIKNTCIILFKSIIGSLIMAAAVYNLHNRITSYITESLSLLLVVIIGAIIYFVMMIILRTEGINDIVHSCIGIIRRH